MNIRIIISSAMLILFVAGQLKAQYDEEFFSSEVLLRNEHYGGVFINTQGGGIEFRKGANTTFFTKWLYEANLLELKSNREVRVYNANPYYRNTRSYIYGKLNNLYTLRIGGGQQKLLNRKPYWGGVEVRYFWFAGGNLGLSKPVYLYIIRDIPMNPFQFIPIEAEKYDPSKHFSDNIYGRASILKGFDEMKIHPGAYAKAGFSFDFATRNEKVSAVEIGAALDFYPAGVPVMAFNPPNRYFLTFYIGYYFGKRYNQ
jgi:hypothetical protein